MDEATQAKVEALLRLAKTHLDAGEAHVAHPLAQRALALAPDHAPTRELAARIEADRRAHKRPALSVIIPTCNRQDILRRCLACLEGQTLPADRFEVLIVDDASDDGTPDFLAGYRPPFFLRVFRQPRRGGPAAARNVAIRAARADVVVFLNDDALLCPEGLAIHLAVQQAAPDADYAVLGRFDLPEAFTATVWGAVMQHSDLPFNYGPLVTNNFYGYSHYYSCNISTPRRALLAAGLFDENFPGPGAEDLDMGRSLMALPTPVPVLYREDCRSTHQHDLTVADFARMSRVRGACGVWMFHKRGEKGVHYAKIRAADVAFWRDPPKRLAERVAVLHDLARRTESIRLRKDGPPPLLSRDAHPELLARCLRLWSLRTRELLEFLDAMIAQVEHLLADIEAGDLSLWQAAARLYPVCLFLRFFHDTEGICGVDNIYLFCRDAVPKAAAVPVSDRSRGKVLLACNFFWPSVGGTELLVEQLGQQLLQAGYEVDVACRFQEDRPALTRNGLRIHQFRCHNRFFDASMGPDARAYRDHVASGGYKAALVLAHPDNWSSHLLRDLPAGRPRLLLMPSINAENVRQWEERGVMDTVAGTLRAADALIAVSQSGHDRRLFADLGLADTFIPHAVETPLADAGWRECYALDRDRPLLACVGNFWPVKNQAALLRTLAGAPGDWQLALAGAALPWEMEQAYFNDCWNLAQADRRARLLGPLPPAEAAALIAQADLLLVPSLGESAGPLVVLQAMASGTPWLATPACNAVADEAGGLVVELSAFPRVISALLARPGEAAALGELGREHWAAAFTWERSLPLFLDLIEGRPPEADLRMPADLRARQARAAAQLLSPAG